MANTYAVDCDCGKVLSVTAAAAGTSVSCECGADVSIPGLSKLRQSVGQDAYITNSAEKITSEHNAGREPAGTDCLLCGGAGHSQIDIEIVCEQQVVKHAPGRFRDLVWIACFGWLGALHVVSKSKNLDDEAVIQGRRRTVQTHFRVCHLCSPNPKKPPSVGNIRRLLQQRPLYNRLFEEFPQAKINLLRTHTD